ncbi:MAG TPA: polyphosphate kinase 2 family protein [Phycisphaerales bacterium]|nr:polyphosphate kinase 2 family protein [Phycisphaerales bacterium]HMP37504.1 polyphosphate kinase 2 family protein [Phycisphaerales bacterium]
MPKPGKAGRGDRGADRDSSPDKPRASGERAKVPSGSSPFRVSAAGLRQLDRLIDRTCLVKPGSKARVASRQTAPKPHGRIEGIEEDNPKERARSFLAGNLVVLTDAQELLWANATHSILVVLQAMDAAGKDGTIKHVMSGLNPAGCRVESFKQPTREDLARTWLWRYWRAVPRRGEICVFNRSHYEDVLVTRVHPELLEGTGLPPGRRDGEFWRRRLEDINAFERHLAENGTLVLKFFLNVSRAEQRRRFLDRLDEREKNWKFSPSDVRERGHWDDYMKVYEKAITATSAPWAPWYIVPADRKGIMRAVVARVIARSIQGLKLRPPEVSEAKRAELESARAALLAEKG